MRFWLLAAGLAVFVAGGRAQDIAGDWQGALSVNGAELRVVLRLSRDAAGKLQGTLDSLDQPGANGIPVTAITLQAGKLSLRLDSIHGSYEGQVAAGGKSISGTWSQGAELPLEFKRAAAPLASARAAGPTDIDGAWMGTLDTGAIQLRVVFHLFNTDDGLKATMDSPDQGARGIPVSSVTRTGPALQLAAKSIGGEFKGKIAADNSAIEGTWSQGGGTLPLVLKPLKNQAELERKRPQNPRKPYPYHEEAVAYDNPVQGVRLAGTLTLPPGTGPFPAVLLITGSGPQDRDESLLGHKPFLVLADYLTRRGIAVLRADDRGVGKSTGVFAKATTADFATDAEAGIAYLLTRPEIDPRKIGLIGHSEGGIIAPMIAARNTHVAFIVMMAGTGVPGDALLVAQTEAIEASSGATPDAAAKDAAQEREILKLMETGAADAVLEQRLKEMLSGSMPEGQIAMQINEIKSPWFRYFLTYDPTTALRRVTCPVLAINGGKDTQVPPGLNLPAIRQALEQGGNMNFAVVELPGLNHLFQTAKTGSPAEYAQIEETIAPVALDKMAGWILSPGVAGGSR